MGAPGDVELRGGTMFRHVLARAVGLVLLGVILIGAPALAKGGGGGGGGGGRHHAPEFDVAAAGAVAAIVAGGGLLLARRRRS